MSFSPPNSVLLLCEGNTGGLVGGGDVTLAFSGVGGVCDSQLRSKKGMYAVIAEGLAGIGRRWVIERI